MHKTQKIIIIVCALFVGILFLGLALSIIQSPPKVSLFIDNGLGEPVSVTVDSLEPMNLDAHTIGRQEVSTGIHKVEVKGKDGAAIETREADCKRIGFVYVYNIKTASRYAQYTMAYGGVTLKEEEMIKPLEAKAFFEAGWELSEPFPSSITVKGGGTALSRIGHFPLHKDLPCCQPLYKSIFK